MPYKRLLARVFPSAGSEKKQAWESALWWLVALMVPVLAVLVWLDFQAVWYPPYYRRSTFFKLLGYWACWLLWPLLLCLLLQIKHQRQTKALWALGGAMLCSGLIWARFIEPSLLVVHETTLSSNCATRIALISDVHMGTYVRTHDLKRLVNKLNTLQVDAVLVAGDWTAEPPRDLTTVFAPLSQLRHPMYSVSGNHDEQKPGPPLLQTLHQALKSAGVHNIEGQRVKLGQCELVGLGDLRAGSTALHLDTLSRIPTDMPTSQRIVLTHEPETAEVIPAHYAAWILAGHTHGGQVNLPWITQRILRSYRFNRGIYKLQRNNLFVTAGIGTSGIPFRLGVLPSIDILQL
jgi:uncharacterized protein